jgi:hypothetical protein
MGQERYSLLFRTPYLRSFGIQCNSLFFEWLYCYLLVYQCCGHIYGGGVKSSQKEGGDGLEFSASAHAQSS